jgi:DNA-binding transcriptional ArsR family regulator
MSLPNAVFRALADPSRRKILRLLRDGPLTSGEVAAQFPTAWATTSRHLGVLRESELVIAERDGNSIRYELNTTVVHEVVNALLDHVHPGGDNA